MTDRTFQVAYARVRDRHTDQDWFALSTREIADLIYCEIRLIDGEVAGVDAGFARMDVAAE